MYGIARAPQAASACFCTGLYVAALPVPDRRHEAAAAERVTAVAAPVAVAPVAAAVVGVRFLPGNPACFASVRSHEAHKMRGRVLCT